MLFLEMLSLLWLFVVQEQHYVKDPYPRLCPEIVRLCLKDLKFSCFRCTLYLNTILEFLLLWWNTMTKRQVGYGKEFSAYASILLFITEGSQDRNSPGQDPRGRNWLMQRPWTGAAYWLAFTGLLSLISYRTQEWPHSSWAKPWPTDD